MKRGFSPPARGQGARQRLARRLARAEGSADAQLQTAAAAGEVGTVAGHADHSSGECAGGAVRTLTDALADEGTLAEGTLGEGTLAEGTPSDEGTLAQGTLADREAGRGTLADAADQGALADAKDQCQGALADAKDQGALAYAADQGTLFGDTGALANAGSLSNADSLADAESLEIFIRIRKPGQNDLHGRNF